jgi:hypothetical protein
MQRKVTFEVTWEAEADTYVQPIVDGLGDLLMERLTLLVDSGSLEDPSVFATIAVYDEKGGKE